MYDQILFDIWLGWGDADSDDAFNGLVAQLGPERVWGWGHRESEIYELAKPLRAQLESTAKILDEVVG